MKVENKDVNAVFIDVDRTLLSCESFRLFLLKRYFGSDFLKIWNLFISYFLSRIHFYDISKFKQKSLSIFIGINRLNLEILGYQFSQTWLLKNIRPGALKCLNQYKVKGIPIYLATASPIFYIKALANQLELAGFIATELEYDKNDRFTGKFIDGECSGIGKAKRIEIFSKNIGIDLKYSLFYSDSYEDLPLLTSVGLPIAVWPDNNLKEISIQRGWSIEYW